MFTENQKKALDYRRHLCVTANAGAGKTTVLVHRFVDILLNTDSRVDQLVAITFTDKAASELKKKIAERIEQNIASAGSKKELIRLEQIRDQLATANIGTIHSFCAKLLREFPVEADVDAGFTVLEGVDQDLLAQETIRTALESMLSNTGDKEERLEVLEIIRMLGQRTVQKYLSAFLRKREQIDRLLQSHGDFLLNAPVKEVLSDWKSRVIEIVVRHLDTTSWLDAVRRLCSVADGKKAQEVLHLYKDWNPKLSAEKKLSVYRELVGLVLTKKNTLRKEFIGSGAKQDGCAADELLLGNFHGSIGELVDALDDADALQADQTLLRLTRTLLNVYQQVLKTYEEKKSENGHLDFEDLQLKTRNLLGQEVTRQKIADKFTFIMVDEYQDTNSLQYDIIRSLTSDYQSGNLFIVGDPKQSIYGFRNAEVEIFEKAKSDILSAGREGQSFQSDGIELSSTSDERKGLITLPESFRPLKHIVAFVNKVFSSAMNDPSDIQYDELVKGRADEEGGNVELMLIATVPESETENESQSDPAKAIRSECLMIARRIVELAKEQYPIFDKKEKKLRSFRYQDAAILLRSRTHLREIEKALVDYNIPYLLSGGIGFYQTQEVFDFLNYFKFFLNPEDDVALMGILRSPFFAISDAELFEISLSGKEETFWNKSRQYCAQHPATALLKRAVKILQSDLDQAKRLPVPFLVQRIFRNTGWEGTVAGLSSGGQSAANVRKLLSIAREFADRGLTTLYDFVERLKVLAEQQEREGQASLDTAGNCVHVMTIHAAKGLEFPAVFIPFAHREFRYDSPPYIDVATGFGFKVRSESDHDTEQSPLLYRYLQRQSNHKTESEERRILYVACTRARDMLVISGQADSRKKHTTYLQWIMDGLGLDVSLLKPGNLSFPVSMSVLSPKNGSATQERINHSLNITVSYGSNEKIELQSNVDESSPDFGKNDLLIQPLKGQTRGEFFSSTQLRVFLECPSKYYLTYVLGVPEKNRTPASFDEHRDPDDTIIGELEGSLTHTVLQNLQSHDTEETIDNAVRQITGTAILGNQEKFDSVVQSIASNIVNFKNSSFGAEALSAKEIRTEYTLSSVFHEDYLTGTIDRLFKNKEGLWSIIDYKTDRIQKNELMHRAEHYKDQMLLYALLISRQFQQKKVRSSIVFLRHSNAPVHYDFSEKDLLNFEAKIQDAIARIKARNFDRTEEMCKNCTFQFGQFGEKCILPKKPAQIT